MEGLTIRRNRSFAVPQRQETVRAAKSAAGASGGQAAQKAGVTVSDTLRQVMSRVNQATEQSRESRRTLQTGEGVLAEVQEKLGRMQQIAEEASGETGADREALQAELERLQSEIDRMISSASAGGTSLFLDADSADAEALLQALTGQMTAKQDALQSLPAWLVKAAAQDGFSPKQLLAALGLDGSAAGAQLLAAVTGRSLSGSPAAGYLAALYLGAVIAGGDRADTLDPAQAMEGLRRLLARTAEGVPPDEAVNQLTGGTYTSLLDFQEQFASGAVPGLENFLTNLLLSEGGGALPEIPSLLNFLAGAEGMDLELMMMLLTAGQTQTPPPEAALEQTSPDGLTEAVLQPEQSGPMTVAQFGDFQVMGRDLSGVSFDEAAGRLTVSGTADVVIRTAAPTAQEIELTGTGTATLQNVRASSLTASVPEVRVFTSGETVLTEVRLGTETVLTLDGRGVLRTEAFRGGEHGLLRLTGGAVAVTSSASNTPGVLTIPVELQGAASLSAQASVVRDASGHTLEPLDLLWEAFLPGFSAVTSMSLNGHHARMALQGGELQDAARLWLAKGDLTSHGYPAHTLVIRGRDEAGQVRTRYAYLRWERRSGAFQEISMYPNPFTVTGGEQDRDWAYEEESHTLQILTAQVTGISGGAGTDARQEPFSGRISLADQIGALKLSLNGVNCRVASGQAFHLGRENEVTLLLRTGTSNFFESGAGCAGISLGEGTSLRIDCVQPRPGETAGVLTATGGAGGAGIGQDSASSRDRSGHIMIRGGAATGSEKPGAAGSVTIAASAAGGTSDLGSARTWARMGIFLQMGEDAVILPQFPLSSRTLQLNKLRVSTREYAHAARMTIDADRRWVSQIQTAYSTLSNRLEQSLSGLNSAGQYFGAGEGPVRDSTAASVLMREISRSAPILSDRAMQVRSLQSLEEVNRLLR